MFSPFTETAFEILINAFQGWMYCYFLDKVLTRKTERSNTAFLISFWTAVLCVTAFYSLYIWVNVPVADTVVWIFPLVFAFFMHSEKRYVILLWVICFATLMLCIANLYTSLFISITGLAWEELMLPSLTRVIYVLCANASMFVVLYIVSIIKTKALVLSKMAIVLFCLLNGIIVACQELLYYIALKEQSSTRYIPMVVFALLVIEILVLIVFEILTRLTVTRINLEKQIEIERLTNSYIGEIQTMYSELLEVRHDMKHHISLLDKMISDGNIVEGREYLSSISLPAAPLHYTTGCLAVDAIISTKMLRMTEDSIPFDFASYPLKDVRIDQTDLCSLIGNLLDNAIEATLRLPEPHERHEISLQIAKTRGMLYITCRNHADVKTIIVKGNTFLSSKRKDSLGYGIQSMRNITDEYSGDITFNVGEESMEVQIQLCCDTTREKISN